MSAPEVAFRRVSVSTAAAELRQESFRDFREGADGSLWLAGDYGLARRLPSGRWMTYKIRGRTASESTTVRQDSSGRIWYTDRSNVYVLVPEPEASLSGLADKAEHDQIISRLSSARKGGLRPYTSRNSSVETISRWAQLCNGLGRTKDLLQHHQISRQKYLR